MKINQAGIALLCEFEGCRLDAYPDPGTGAQPWTIGYGHTGPDVEKGMRITQERANELLREDLKRFEVGVSSAIGDSPATSNQFSAMVCLAYNIGISAFSRSSVCRFHKNGKYESAASAFGLWNKSSGIVMKGLTRRRAAEAALYRTP